MKPPIPSEVLEPHLGYLLAEFATYMPLWRLVEHVNAYWHLASSTGATHASIALTNQQRILHEAIERYGRDAMVVDVLERIQGTEG